MQATNVDALERTIQKTNEWLGEIQDEIGGIGRHEAYAALRATLHVLRDRLPPVEALQLGSQLTTLVRGIYFEGFKLSERPARVRSLDEFLGAMAVEAGRALPDTESAARAVFRVLARHVSAGEIKDVKSALPPPLRELWSR
jgi:uncharacterized protein (DUF2267 family)